MQINSERLVWAFHFLPYFFNDFINLILKLMPSKIEGNKMGCFNDPDWKVCGWVGGVGGVGG